MVLYCIQEQVSREQQGMQGLGGGVCLDRQDGEGVPCSGDRSTGDSLKGGKFGTHAAWGESVWWGTWSPSGSPGGWLKHVIGVPQPWPRLSMPLDPECGLRYSPLASSQLLLGVWGPTLRNTGLEKRGCKMGVVGS